MPTNGAYVPDLMFLPGPTTQPAPVYMPTPNIPNSSGRIVSQVVLSPTERLLELNAKKVRMSPMGQVPYMQNVINAVNNGNTAAADALMNQRFTARSSIEPAKPQVPIGVNMIPGAGAAITYGQMQAELNAGHVEHAKPLFFSGTVQSGVDVFTIGSGAAVMGGMLDGGALNSLSKEVVEPADLRPYGGPGGGHHVPAKSAFEGAANYDMNKALAIPNEELLRLGIKHSDITAAQQIGYRAFAQAGAAISWDAVERIETDALVRAGMQPDVANATVRAAVNKLKAMGINPTRIPWGG